MECLLIHVSMRYCKKKARYLNVCSSGGGNCQIHSEG